MSNRKLKALPIVDVYTKKCHRIEVDTSINGVRVCRVLDEVGEREGLPEVIMVDNGPEFAGKALERALMAGYAMNALMSIGLSIWIMPGGSLKTGPCSQIYSNS